MEPIVYCKICGCAPLLMKNTICPNCKNWLIMGISKYDNEYYVNKSIEKYGDRTHWREFLDEEAKENPEYNPNTTEHTASNAFEQQINEIFSTQRNNTDIPKCPTCGSTKLKKISGVKRAAHMWTFGLFSKTSYSQFECENCGYKW